MAPPLSHPRIPHKRVSRGAPVIVLLAALAPVPADAIELELPLACTPGESCFIQQYADWDSGPAATDFTCGTQTYDGHTGTDFRLVDLRAMDAGVAVLAATAGRVRAIRNDMADVFKEDAEPGSLEQRSCGNAVIIDHEDGYQTQYCHLKKGSVGVRPGEKVAAGAHLAEVGLSGATEFPHLHFELRKDGTVIDPFAGGTPRLPCGGTAESLWSPAAVSYLGYRDVLILNVGFATGPVEMRGIEEGRYDTALTTTAPAIVAYGRAIHVRRGDILTIRIEGPAGVVREHHLEPAPRAQAQRMIFAGKECPTGGFAPGTYTARFAVLREGTSMAERTVTAVLR